MLIFIVSPHIIIGCTDGGKSRIIITHHHQITQLNSANRREVSSASFASREDPRYTERGESLMDIAKYSKERESNRR